MGFATPHARFTETLDKPFPNQGCDRHLVFGDGRVLSRQIRDAVLDAVRVSLFLWAASAQRSRRRGSFGADLGYSPFSPCSWIGIWWGDILRFTRPRGYSWPSADHSNPRDTGPRRPLWAAKFWLASTNPEWNEHPEQAEIEAHIRETAQLVAMREPPTRSVKLLRGGAPDIPALQEQSDSTFQLSDDTKTRFRPCIEIKMDDVLTPV
jgi:hypothetical protein